ncbi:MAG TPA: gephyrin-like molybdotransferase Glp [Isosphaeraceae bacterium]|nr:gephyrin-like molybdotransferase Glp [Isosphaeraceae bacterium]
MSEDDPKRAETSADPRMRGFRTRTAVEDVVAIIDSRLAALGAENLALSLAAGRVLAEQVEAQTPVPPFDRAAMDGYALRGEETFGAEPYSPALFRVMGQSRPGRAFKGPVGPGEAVEITTGAPLPGGSDTVVKVESTRAEGEALAVFEPTPPGRHVSRKGEDVASGTAVLPAGRLLRPQDLGLLTALGMATAKVVRQPKVAILITGDELLPAGSPSRDFQIPDSNSVMLAALVARDGGVAKAIGPLPDDAAMIRAEVEKAAKLADAILISGGSSTGPEDHAPSILAEIGELVAHGIALRPASPAGLAFLGKVPVILLPGNPVSCLCAYDFFGGRVVRRLAGRRPNWPYRPRVCRLGHKLSSALGRVDYTRVKIVQDVVEPLATSGASILSSTTRADGFVVVPANLEGYAAGAQVTVWLYDREPAWESVSNDDVTDVLK